MCFEMKLLCYVDSGQFSVSVYVIVVCRYHELYSLIEQQTDLFPAVPIPW